MSSSRPTLNFAKYLWQHYRKSLIFGILTLCLGAFVDASAALMVAPIFDLIMNDQGAGAEYTQVTQRVFEFFDSLGLPKTSIFALGFFLFLYISRSFVTILTNYFMAKIRAALQKDMVLNLYKAVVNANWKFYLTRNQGQFINSITRETQHLTIAYDNLSQMCVSLVQITVFGGLAFLMSWKITLICLGVALCCAIPLFMLTRLSHKWGQTYVASAGVSNSITQESFSLAKVIQAFSCQNYAYDKLSEQQQVQEGLNVRFYVLGKVVQELFYPIGIISIIIAYACSRYFEMSFAQLSIVLYALWKTTPFISSFLSAKSSLGQMVSSFDNVYQLEQDALAHPIQSGEQKFAGLDGGIQLKNLSFAYEGAELKALAQVNIRIKKGQMTALVGSSGSGKSTLADVVMGFHEIPQGDLLIGGVALQDLDLKSYREKIGYVPQQSVLFNTTIRENLLWSKESASEQELIQACQKANAWEFVKKLQQGLDTEVGDRGVRLSGGQIQRLAIARAILRQPEILILDEATSSLDTESEKMIQQSITQIAQETTLIVIAHRLSTIKGADQVIVMKDGSVLEEGSFDELVSKQGEFSSMWNRQMEENK
ncbi:ABC transporter, ATP-binding protein [Lentisphaera araneosa HTCC2155]|uniref:ABC transporter, ATP-binding protein n=1 Tax=Lentisphaera araneosa HTCC2155 TaxID=313628 RepID=A6DT24_9BACT|nr:ABC transporter ATP-binding protein [Lentisphaera araneosa]EDM25199.1 ABC transporter, ATP-binding protein [Lentisphaera araneosa HTCC2155]